ncbi:MAG: TOBE domain-containing protein [Acidimicrobiia bacterium]|nr:TOBE domain-containing protein [Acidimicrobiia bacterium]
MATHGAEPGQAVTVAIRPERFTLFRPDDEIPSDRSSIAGKVVRRIYHGDVFLYDVETAEGLLEVKEENRPTVEVFDVDAPVTVTWNPSAATVIED